VISRRALVIGAACAGAATLLYVTRDNHDVDLELPLGRALLAPEEAALRRVAEAAFRDARALLEGLPSRLRLLLRWGKDVIPGMGSNGTASFPGNVALTLDPDADVLATIDREVRATLVHELHHLARASRVTDETLVDRVVTEGLATAFERDVCKTEPPWGVAPPEEWTHEVLALPADTDPDPWLHRHPDGRRWVGMRVGTHLVDRAAQATGKTAATLVFASSAEIVRATMGR
jgi:hypothetical protein